MQEIIKLIVGCLVLVIGYFIGIILARETKEELKSGQKWFKLIILISLIGGFIGLIIGNDALMFGFFFIAIVTIGSLRKKSKSH
jgi:hypothetical protein